jgi:hypothetical protein
MSEERTQREYESQFSYIVTDKGIAEIIDWIQENGTENEWLWWWSRYLESLTGEQITNGLDEAALGHNKANAIRVAGHRFQEKLVKSYLKPKLEPVLD